MARVFKIAVVGGSDAGKTSYIRRLIRREFTGENERTMGVEVAPLYFRVNRGGVISDVVFNIWDCGGTYRGLEDGYCIGANAVIVMYNAAVNNANIAGWINDIRRHTNVIIYCGNKCDIGQRPAITEGNRNFFVSALEDTNCWAPIEHLVRVLCGENSVIIHD
jgi:small GTP-binding protein